jgi:DNA topoisomerase-2
MKGEPMVPMSPWYRGFKGRIEKVDNKGKYICSGIARVVDSKTVEIIELPVKKWTDDYKKQLEDWIVGNDKEKIDKEKAKVGETFVKVRF